MYADVDPCQIYIINWGRTREQINVLPGGLIRSGFRTAAVAASQMLRRANLQGWRRWAGRGVLEALASQTLA